MDWSVHHEDIIIINIYDLNNIASKHMKQTLADLKGERQLTPG